MSLHMSRRSPIVLLELSSCVPAGAGGEVVELAQAGGGESDAGAQGSAVEHRAGSHHSQMSGQTQPGRSSPHSGALALIYHQ